MADISSCAPREACMRFDHFLQQASLEAIHVQAMWWWLQSSCLQPTPVASQLFDMSVFAFDTYEFGLAFCKMHFA
jgi:hypothetical protein